VAGHDKSMHGMIRTTLQVREARNRASSYAEVSRHGVRFLSKGEEAKAHKSTGALHQESEQLSTHDHTHKQSHLFVVIPSLQNLPCREIYIGRHVKDNKRRFHHTHTNARTTYLGPMNLLIRTSARRHVTDKCSHAKQGARRLLTWFGIQDKEWRP